jgi:hypothetical protein
VSTGNIPQLNGGVVGGREHAPIGAEHEWAIEPSQGQSPTTTCLRKRSRAGAARLTEVGGGGSVPELRFENLGERPVLLLDGGRADRLWSASIRSAASSTSPNVA